MKTTEVFPRLALVATLAAAVAMQISCNGSDDETDPSAKMHTIEQEHLTDTTLQSDTAAPSNQTETDAAPALPFQPPISMDPVDGSKVSIRRTTPSTEYAGKIYHFSSEENLKLFLQDPKKYVGGSLATY